MSESKRAIASDLKALDAHVIKPEEYEDAPELTDEQLAEADLHEGGKLVRRGRPPSAHRKVPVKVRLDPDVVAALRNSGPGWQTRMNDMLRTMVLKKHIRPGAIVKLTAKSTRLKKTAKKHAVKRAAARRRPHSQAKRA